MHTTNAHVYRHQRCPKFDAHKVKGSLAEGRQMAAAKCQNIQMMEAISAK